MAGMIRIAAVLLVASVALGARPIKHVSVLMEENRSFDHMFGWVGPRVSSARRAVGTHPLALLSPSTSYNKNQSFNGLKGNESNPISTTDPHSKRVTVSANSPYVGPCDPCHGTPCTTQKLYVGQTGPSTARVSPPNGALRLP